MKESNHNNLPVLRAGKCPVTMAVALISGKWKSVILYHLQGGTLRFNALQRLIGGITHRSLAIQLRELERDGLVGRRVFAEVPPRVEYTLTPLGHSMEPILRALYDWGTGYMENR